MPPDRESKLDPDALPLRTRRSVRRCAMRLRECAALWDDLSPTEAADVRHCGACQRNVYFCRSDEETIEHALAGHCIAREEPDPSELARVVLGRPSLPVVETARQERARGWRSRERGIREAIRGRVARDDSCCAVCGYFMPSWRVTCYVCGERISNTKGRT